LENASVEQDQHSLTSLAQSVPFVRHRTSCVAPIRAQLRRDK
jgi:hypothetical protein